MAVPEFASLLLPVLAECALGTTTSADIRKRVAARLKLTKEDIEQRLPSGTQTTLANRTAWATIYLERAALLRRVRKGVYEITDAGRVVLASPPGRIDLRFLEQFPAYRQWKEKTPNTEIRDSTRPAATTAAEEETNPEERLEQSHRDLTAEVEAEVLERLLNVTPAQFEQIIIDLLVAMGYGGGRAEMARAIGRSGDGGVDGMIREDRLGLDIVYMQAKRYALTNVVQIAEVREFIGSLDNKRASKGVFVTTSRFVRSAHDEVRNSTRRVALIEGTELARFMVEHNVGGRTKSTYLVKEIDEDYFEG